MRHVVEICGFQFNEEKDKKVTKCFSKETEDLMRNESLHLKYLQYKKSKKWQSHLQFSILAFENFMSTCH